MGYAPKIAIFSYLCSVDYHQQRTYKLNASLTQSPDSCVVAEPGDFFVMSNEIWKNAPGFPGYQVSDAGRVRSNGRILRVDNVKGYDRVRLYRDKHVVRMLVHRLVALAFIPNPDGLPQINHKNEIKTDNRVENLEWCTAKYNNSYGTGRKRAAKSRSRAVGQYTTNGVLVATYTRIKDAREKYGVHIFSVLAGRRKTAGGFIWKYI